MNIQKCLLISTAILLVTPIIGCARGPSLEEVMAKAYAATEELQSYRVESRLAQSKEVAMGLSSEATFEMEVVAPDRCHLTIHLGGDWGEDEFITIGEKQYSRHYRDSKWSQWGLSPHPTNGYGIYVSAPRQTLLLLHSLTDLKELQDAKVEGVDCLHYQGRVDMDKVVEEGKTKLDPSMSGYENIAENLEYQRQLKIEVEIWIGKEDYLIRQMKEDLQWQPVGAARKVHKQIITISSLTRYYDFNTPIEIEPPKGGANLTWDITYGSKLYMVEVYNSGMEVAKNVRVFAYMPIGPLQHEVKEMMPEKKGPVDLEPGEGEKYCVTYEYGLPDGIRVTWVSLDGEEKEEISGRYATLD
jgi:hypothetical protein